MTTIILIRKEGAMLRRQFLKEIVTGILSLPFLSARRAESNNLPLFDCMVAGFQYHSGPPHYQSSNCYFYTIGIWHKEITGNFYEDHCHDILC
jgi:hypothetical protein